MILTKNRTKLIDIRKIIPDRILTKSGNKIYKLNITLPRGKVLISRAKEKHGSNYIKKWVKVPDESICIWYSWPSGRNQSSDKNNGVRFKYFILPRFIPLDDVTLIALGLLEAEMETSQKRANMVSFTNSEPNLVNYIIRFFERLGIKTLDWHWYITFNFKLMSYESVETTRLREKLAEEYWLANTPISPLMKTRKYFQYTGNKKCINMRDNTVRWGSLRIACFDTILRAVIINLLKNIKTLLLKTNDENIIKYYMQGIFAGECDVKRTQSGSVDSVRIGCMDTFNKNLYKKCLKKLRIRVSKDDSNSVYINNKENFYKVYKLGLISLHPVRYKKFLIGLLKFKKFNKSEGSIKEKLMDIRYEIENIIREITPPLERREMIFGGLSELHSVVERRSSDFFSWRERKKSN